MEGLHIPPEQMGTEIISNKVKIFSGLILSEPSVLFSGSDGFDFHKSR